MTSLIMWNTKLFILKNNQKVITEFHCISNKKIYKNKKKHLFHNKQEIEIKMKLKWFGKKLSFLD